MFCGTRHINTVSLQCGSAYGGSLSFFGCIPGRTRHRKIVFYLPYLLKETEKTTVSPWKVKLNACMPFRVGKVILPERTETNIERGRGASDMLCGQTGYLIDKLDYFFSSLRRNFSNEF